MKRYIRSDTVLHIGPGTYYRIVFYVNGFTCDRWYFNQWYFSESDKDRLYNGKSIDKDGNTFYIEVVNGSNHIEKPYVVLDQDEFYNIAF